jgi:thioredoxin reductase
MNTKRMRKMGSFQVKTESGEERTIDQYQEYAIIATGGGASPTEVPGLPRYVTRTGLELQPIDVDAKTFKIVKTDEIVRRV